jgi:hypothetical protein
MTAVEDRQLIAVMDVRLRWCRATRCRRAPPGCRARRARAPALDSGRFGGDRASQRGQNVQLVLEDALVGAQHLFVFLERRGDEAFAAGNRLLAVVVGRDGVKIDFEISLIAEDGCN